MKKTLITLIAFAGFAASSFAQGTVIFSNSSSSLVTFGEGANSGNALPADGSFSVALYWAPQGTTDLTAFTQLGASASIAPVPGRYSGGLRTTGVGTAPGGTGAFLVRAWSTADGATWEEASTVIGAWQGTSTVFESATGGVGDPPSPAISLNTSAVPFSVVTVVPEPSVIALGAVGLGLLWFRRKK